MKVTASILHLRPSSTPNWQLLSSFFPEPRAASLSALGHIYKDSGKGCAETLACRNLESTKYESRGLAAGMVCRWALSRALGSSEEAEVLTLFRHPGAEELALFFLSWRVGHKTESAPRCLLWLRVRCWRGLMRSRVPVPDTGQPEGTPGQSPACCHPFLPRAFQCPG